MARTSQSASDDSAIGTRHEVILCTATAAPADVNADFGREQVLQCCSAQGMLLDAVVFAGLPAG